jgi:hypothetical protein
MALPTDLSPTREARMADVFAGVRGVVRVFVDESDAGW